VFPLRPSSLLIAGSLAFGVVGLAEDARACSQVTPETHVIDSSQIAIDQTPPSAPSRVSAHVWRRLGELCDDEECESNTCGDTAGIDLTFIGSRDDRSGPEAIGYRLDFVSGSVPPSLQYSVPRPASSMETILIPFDDALLLDAQAVLVALDAAGNTSEPSPPFAVQFRGCTYEPTTDECAQEEGVSCQLAPVGARSTPWSPAWLVIALVLPGLARCWRRAHSA